MLRQPIRARIGSRQHDEVQPPIECLDMRHKLVRLIAALCLLLPLAAHALTESTIDAKALFDTAGVDGTMVVYDVLSRTSHDTHEEEYRRRFGESDLAIDAVGINMIQSTGTGERPAAADFVALLPPGSRILEVHTLHWAPVRVAGAPDTVRVVFTDLPLGDPMLTGTVEVSDGRVPSAVITSQRKRL